MTLDFSNTKGLEAINSIQTETAFEMDTINAIAKWADGSPKVQFFTSGSTGPPAEVFLEKSFLKSCALRTAKHFDLAEGSRALLCLPVDKIAGFMMVVRAIECHWKLKVITPSLEIPADLTSDFDFAAFTVPQALSAIKSLISGSLRIKSAIVGGSELNASMISRLQPAPVMWYETYGMTETGSHVAIRPLQLPFFVPIRGVTITQDERGCAVITDELTTTPIVTNDLIEMPDSNRFKLVGRLDNVINSGGLKLYPEVMEARLSVHIRIPFFIASVKDEQLGRAAVVVVEGHESSAIIDAVKKALEDEFKGEVSPKGVIFNENFERTSTGKIIRWKSTPEL